MKGKFLLLALAAMPLVTACERDAGAIVDPLPPLGFVRYVHGVPNAGGVDLRMIDRVDFAPFEIGLGYRGIGRYQEAATGQRRIRMFPRSTNIDTASTILLDSTITVEAGAYYTVLVTGRAGGAPALRFQVFRDSAPTPTGTQFAIRAVHAGVGVGAVDVFGTRLAADPLPGSPTFGNLTYLNRSIYAAVDTGTFAVRLFGAGTTTPALVTGTVPAGALGTTGANPVGGTRVPGTALSAFAFAPGDAGSPNAGVTAPSVVFAVDRRPADTVR